MILHNMLTRLANIHAPYGMTPFIQSPLYRFGIRLKGPTAQRSKLQRDTYEDLLNQQAKAEDYFRSYTPTISNLYKNNFTKQQLQKSPQAVKRTFSLDNATPTEVLAYKAIQKFQVNPLDHGSAAIQCAILSQRILLMMIHTHRYHKDYRSARGLTKLIQTRRTMMNYLFRTDYHRWKWVCMEYGLPEEVGGRDIHKKGWKRHNSKTGI